MSPSRNLQATPPLSGGPPVRPPPLRTTLWDLRPGVGGGRPWAASPEPGNGSPPRPSKPELLPPSSALLSLLACGQRGVSEYQTNIFLN